MGHVLKTINNSSFTVNCTKQTVCFVQQKIPVIQCSLRERISSCATPIFTFNSESEHVLTCKQ